MEKVLFIENEKNLRTFYHYLFLYKSFLYRFVNFRLDEDKFDISGIVEALNIKNKKKRVEFIYDRACDEVDNFFANKNICNFKNGQCGIQRKLKNNKFNGCCRRCAYQTSKGCPTKNLACKLFFCSYIKDRYDIIKLKDLKILKALYFRQRAIVKSDYFSSRRDVINDLYLNSYIIGNIRILYRIIKKNVMLLFKKKRHV